MNATPAPRPRPRRMSQDDRRIILRARAISIISRARFGVGHPAVRLSIEHLNGVVNARTARHRADFILEFLDWCYSQGLDPFALRRLHATSFLSSLPSHFSRSSQHKRMSAIRSWYLDANDARLCGSNPFYRVGPSNIDPEHPTPAIPLEAVDRLITTCLAPLESGKATPVDWRDAVAVYVMTRVGPRRFEAAAGQWWDLEVTDGVTRWKIEGKHDQTGRTTLPHDVVALLDAWKVRLGGIIGRAVRPDDALFPVLGQGPAAIMRYAAAGPLEGLLPETLGNIYKSALINAGLRWKRFGAHVARATAATLAYRAGASDRDIQRMLRHKMLATTHRYIRLLEDTESPAEAWQTIPFPIPGIAGVAAASAITADGPKASPPDVDPRRSVRASSTAVGWS